MVSFSCHWRRKLAFGLSREIHSCSCKTSPGLFQALLEIIPPRRRGRQAGLKQAADHRVNRHGSAEEQEPVLPLPVEQSGELFLLQGDAVKKLEASHAATGQVPPLLLIIMVMGLHRDAG